MEQLCSTEVTLFFKAISPHIDVYVTQWQVFENSAVALEDSFQRSRPFSNSSFYFLATVQSMNFLVLLRRPKQNSGRYRRFKQNDSNNFVSDLHCPAEESHLGTKHNLEHPQW